MIQNLFLTLSHTVPTFKTLRRKAFENIVGKEEFSPFPTMFSTLSA